MRNLQLLWSLLFVVISAPAFGQYTPPQASAPRATVCCAPEGVLNYPQGSFLFVCNMLNLQQGICVVPEYAGESCKLPKRWENAANVYPGAFVGISCDNGQNCTRCIRNRRVCRTAVGVFTNPNFYGVPVGTPCTMNTTQGSFRGEIDVPN